MPERDPNAKNHWKLLKGEFIQSTDGRIFAEEGGIVRVEEFSDLELISAMLPDGSKFELKGKSFEEAVRKVQPE